jgi:citrate lyase subunit beta / citryl-CoA lyase
VRDDARLLLRALLFVPGSDERKLAKASALGADAIVIDLEDAVAESEKTAARASTGAAIGGWAGDQLVAVRVNGPGSGRLEDDIASVVRPGLAALAVPKVEDAEALRIADRSLSAAEREHGMEPGGVRILALIETALGVVRADEVLLQAPARTLTTIFGLADFAADLGLEPTRDGNELLYARGRVVVATRAAGMAAPIDGPYLQIGDEDGLIADCRLSRALGFQGRVTIHPSQVAPTQRAYSELSAESLESQRRIVEAFEEAQAAGVAAVRVDGTFVDYPIYRRALQAVTRYESLSTSGP